MKLTQEGYHTSLVVCSPIELQKQLKRFSRKKKRWSNLKYANENKRTNERTWQNPDTPAIDNKLDALGRNTASVVAGVCRVGGSP